MGTLKVLDRKVHVEDSQPEAADSLRAAIYQVRVQFHYLFCTVFLRLRLETESERLYCLRTNNKPPLQPSVQLENRFPPVLSSDRHKYHMSV